jgi:hypothetical protein
MHWNAHLIDTQVWIWADDSSGAEIDTFSTEVSTEPTLFAFETLT